MSGSTVVKDSKRKRRFACKVGVCVLVLAVCLFLALTIGDADYRATPLGWMPLFVVLALALLCRVYIVLAGNSIAYSDSLAFANCMRGESAPFSVEIENRGPLVLLSLKVELFVADASNDSVSSVTTTLSLGPHARHEIPFNVPFSHIGLFSAGLKSVVVKDYLGLFEKRIEGQRESFICITPKVPRLGSMRYSEDSDVENMRMLKTVLASSLDYAYVRDYEPGDPLKTIHWKLSARSDHYLTRLFEKTVNPGVIVVMDFYVSGDDVEERMELRDIVVESALSIADYSRSKGLDAEVRYIDRYGEKRCLNEWDRESLAGFVREIPSPNRSGQVERNVIGLLEEISFDMQAQNNVVVCSARVDDNMVGELISVKKRHKAPFFVAAVPHRLVDRDLERYITPLSALEAHRIGCKVIADSEELEGWDL